VADYQRNQLKEYSQACIAAFQFLTRIPIRKEVPFEQKILHKAVIFFPIVGVIIGLILTILSAFMLWLLPQSLAAVGIVLAWVMLTGGLHLDGLMDTADGILSGRTKEKMLEIMKDSRVGAMGVLAAIFVILLKVIVVYELMDTADYHVFDLKWMLIALVSSAMWSRWWMVVAIAHWKPARASGLGQLFQGISLKYVSYSTVISLFLYVIPVTFYVMNFREDPYVLWLTMFLPVLNAVLGYILAKWMTAKLGGLTGDTYGAMTELLELVNIVMIVSFIKHVSVIAG